LSKDVKLNYNVITGMNKVSGTELFGGSIEGIGGEYDQRYAIVKKADAKSV
jgi:hypothetical protein